VEVYLNNAATSWPKPERVYEAADHYLRRFASSQGRGGFRRSQEATDIIENCRKNLARLFNVQDPSRLVFTKNCSEALNQALKGFLRPGDHVITSSMEHNSVWRPLNILEKKGLISLTTVVCNEQGKIGLDDLKKAFRPETRLLVCAHASNVTGTLFPLAEISHLAHSHKAYFLVDGAQTSGVYPVDITGLNIDLFACSGHKGLLGPQGTGALYISPRLELEPLLEGGTGSSSLSYFQPEILPDRFETGTPNGPGLAGLGAGVKFILGTGVDVIRVKERHLTSMILERISQVPGIIIFGPRDPDYQVAVVSFNVQNVNPEEVGTILDEVYDIAVRVGLHCSPQAHRTIGTIDTGTVRVSPGFFTTPADIDYFIDAIKEIARKAGHVSRRRGKADPDLFVAGYKIQRAAPCFADGQKIRVTASLIDDVEELMPYLNAVLRGAYIPEGKTFTFSFEKRPVVLRPKQVVVGQTDSITDAEKTLDAVIGILNKVAASRYDILPSVEPQKQLNPFALYKALPRTNCKECGEQTCIAFATAVVKGGKKLEQCLHLKGDPRKELSRLLTEYFEGLLPTGEEFIL